MHVYNGVVMYHRHSTLFSYVYTTHHSQSYINLIPMNQIDVEIKREWLGNSRKVVNNRKDVLLRHQ